jgi:hypothetical protein
MKRYSIPVSLLLAGLCAASITAPRAEEEETAASYAGKWELGLFVPFSMYDTEFPVRDFQGEDDEIRNAFGRGIAFGYNFTSRHAVASHDSWVDTDGEDQRGRNFFIVRTRYLQLDYRFTFPGPIHWAPFVQAGIGAFRARAKEINHESFGGRTWTGGAGLRLYTTHRSSMYWMAEAVRVNLHPSDALNYVFSWGITSHLGHGPDSHAPPRQPDEGDPSGD